MLNNVFKANNELLKPEINFQQKKNNFSMFRTVSVKTV